MKRRGSALRYLKHRYIGSDPVKMEALEQERINAYIARTIYRLRTGARLSQRELARRVGTTASVICRLEDTDYQGHSMSMLRRIAAALNRRLEIRFPKVRRRIRAA